MHEINNYISDLLFVHDCVIIPNFGGFVANHCEATINSQIGSFAPPRKLISFNHNLKNNDGLLVNKLKTIKNISYNEAEKLVDLFVEDIYAKLNSGGKFEFPKIGYCYRNRRNIVVFEPYNQKNHLVESYGLGSFSFEKNEIVKPNYSISKPGFFRRSIIKYVAIGLPFVIALSFISNYDNLDLNMASLMWHKSSSDKDLKLPIRSIPRVSPPSNFVDYEPILRDGLLNKGIFLIAGSFTVERNAEFLKSELISHNYSPVIIKNNNLYSVAIGRFPSKEKAIQFKKRVIARNPRSNCWILVR
ncbi:MAG: SPOR domain-containing protein [Marinifilaceae bacterium]|jgi:nucleoid DNA-binding protein|nr:SPOR domain-containing protein [Marinifilaceae bacterium]